MLSFLSMIGLAYKPILLLFWRSNFGYFHNAEAWRFKAGDWA